MTLYFFLLRYQTQYLIINCIIFLYIKYNYLSLSYNSANNSTLISKSNLASLSGHFSNGTLSLLSIKREIENEFEINANV